MFKLNSKYDADSLLCSLNHFECDSHTVHMLTQWHLPPQLTSTVKSSLFTHAHSSTLSLAARLHWCHVNHSRYINNGWSFSRQISYILKPRLKNPLLGKNSLIPHSFYSGTLGCVSLCHRLMAVFSEEVVTDLCVTEHSGTWWGICCAEDIYEYETSLLICIKVNPLSTIPSKKNVHFPLWQAPSPCHLSKLDCQNHQLPSLFYFLFLTGHLVLFTTISYLSHLFFPL